MTGGEPRTTYFCFAPRRRSDADISPSVALSFPERSRMEGQLRRRNQPSEGSIDYLTRLGARNTVAKVCSLLCGRLNTLPTRRYQISETKRMLSGPADDTSRPPGRSTLRRPFLRWWTYRFDAIGVTQGNHEEVCISAPLTTFIP